VRARDAVIVTNRPAAGCSRTNLNFLYLVSIYTIWADEIVLLPRVESAKKSAPKSADIQMTGRNGYIPLKKFNFLRTFMPKA
jgi:hypothetical protein